MTTPAWDERLALCDLMLDVGPDAPTLCGDWNVRDLAAHLVVRERRPDGAIGILVKPFASYAEKVREQAAEKGLVELVDRLRKGPPGWSPTRLDTVDRTINTVEFFIHHEDVRRAQDTWTVRTLGADLEADLSTALRRGARLLARKAPAGLVLESPGREPTVANAGEPAVTATGPTGELVMFVYGRQAHSRAKLSGPNDSVAAMRTASFGI